jgi:hypothetical protein
MKAYFFLCLVALFAIIGLVHADQSIDDYDPTDDPVPGPSPPPPPGMPFTPFDEPIETVDVTVVQQAQPIEGAKYKFAIAMVENNCKLRNQFRGARAFLHNHAGYFPQLYTKLVSGLPRIKFYELEEDFRRATVDPADLTQAELLEVLQKLAENPKYFDPVGKVQEVLLARDTTAVEIEELLDRFSIQKVMKFDLRKRPDIWETSEDRGDGRKFIHDDLLREINPDHDTAAPPTGYNYDIEIAKRDGDAAPDLEAASLKSAPRDEL